MKKKIIVISSILVLISFISIFSCIYIFSGKDESNPKGKEKTINTLNEDKMVDEKVTIPEETIKEEQIVNSTNEEHESVNNSKASSNNNELKETTPKNSTTTSKVDNSNNYQQQKQEPNSAPSSNNEVKEEVVVPKEEPKKYIGVADPNNYNYSFHHGQIDYNANQANKCNEDSINIQFADTVDIINAWCLDVRDSNNTILGYYLYIKCQSGNCERYKN